MGRKGTTTALTFITLVNNISLFGVFGLITSALLLTFPLYLIWFDSKKPFDEQFRFSNSRWGKK